MGSKLGIAIMLLGISISGLGLVHWILVGGLSFSTFGFVPCLEYKSTVK